MKNNASDLKLDLLMERIRTRVAQGQSHHKSVTQKEASAGSMSLDDQSCVKLPRLIGDHDTLEIKREYALAEFLQFHDERFIFNAYSGLLGREVDLTGYQHYMELIRSGALAKVDVVSRLRYSPEGRARGVVVHGLFASTLARSILRLPVIGQIIGPLHYFAKLPRIVKNIERSEAFFHLHRSQLTYRVNAIADSAEAALLHIEAAAMRAHKRSVDTLRALDSKATIDQFDESSERTDRAVAATRLQIADLTMHVSTLADSHAHIATLRSELDAVAFQMPSIATAHSSIAYMRDELNSVSLQQSSQAAESQEQLAELRQRLTESSQQLVALRGQLVESKQQLAEMREQLVASRQPLAESREQLAELRQQLAVSGEQLAASTVRLEGFERSLAESKRDAVGMERELLNQQRSLGVLLERSASDRPRPGLSVSAEGSAEEDEHLLDAFYVAFEDRFRGTREDIKQRLEVYLSWIRLADAGSGDAPILDVGCGRGEWLELLQEAGFRASGLDQNRAMVASCLERGLEVSEGDAIWFLREKRTGSLGAITGFHVIEHVDFRTLIAMLDEVLRVLRPGGIAIFETPNPENLVVGACNFYVDPTHKNPLPPELTAFLFKSRGFARIEVVRLHPMSVLAEEADAREAGILDRYFRSAQDYSIVAFKPVDEEILSDETL